MVYANLDPIDKKILELLTQNARLDYKAISKVVGISDRTVARRIENLEKIGIIEGYFVKVSDKFLNLTSSEGDRYVVSTSILEWESLRNSIAQIFKAGTSVILYYVGIGIGRYFGEKIKKSELEKEGQCFLFTRIFENRGWGKLSFETIDFQQAKGKVLLVDSPFKKLCKGIECYEIRGIIAGFLESIYDKQINVSGEKCVIRGDNRCGFMFNGGETTA